MTIPLALCVFLMSATITRLLVKNAEKIAAIDVPNERSSHSTPTPRGGGLAFVISSIVGFALLLAKPEISKSEFGALIVAGLLVALTGYLDDHQKISGASIRLVIHALGAIVILGFIGVPSDFEIFRFHVQSGVILAIFGVLYLVWLLNLFNFMDGTDGIAASETIFVCVAGALLKLHSTSSSSPSNGTLILASAVIGFILYNWSPAKIFMGDIGSGYLGIVIGGLSLMAAKQNPDLFWAWIILLGVFVSDATVTLIRRLARKKKPHVAHRSHAYQHLAIKLNSHAKVSLIVLVVNVVWLAPIAFFVSDNALDGSMGAVIAYVPLVLAMIALGSGKDSLAN